MRRQQAQRRAPPDYAIDAHGLGVRYNLRLTRQTTVRTSFRDLLKKRDGPTDSGPSATCHSGSSTARASR